VSIFKTILLLIIMVTASAATPPRIEPPAQRVHPVVSLSNYCLLGGVVNRKLIKADKAASSMKSDEKYRVYTLNGPAGELTVNKPAKPDSSCEDDVKIKPSPETGQVIAIRNPQWNPLPRTPQSLSTNDSVYSEAVAGILRTNGINNPTIKISKVLRIDLEGDGTDEVVVSATHYARTGSAESPGMAITPAAGDYSLIFVRKLIRGKVQTIFVEAEYHPKEGRQEDEGPPNAYDVTAIMDINGDGQMEIIVDGGYYEGSWTTVYSIKENKALDVLGCGCGA
jgi:hypothetical protein